MIKLYDYVLSVNCYKQRLMMSILDVAYETVPVDFFPGWEHKGEEFKQDQPAGPYPGHRRRRLHPVGRPRHPGVPGGQVRPERALVPDR